MSITKLWQDIKALFDQHIGTERRIKSVEEWDGSPSQWPDTESYCASCLIDVNSAAGRDEKAQSHCMLPVRSAGDSAETFVDRAVFAAAGGRGLSRVQRPEDVPAEAWDAAIRKAANDIIGAYEEMDRTAPAGVFEAAGKEMPEEERALDLPEFGTQVLEYVSGIGETARLMDIFHDASDMYAVVAHDGKLWRVGLGVNEMDEVMFAEPEQVKMEFSPVGRMMISRRAGSPPRWIAVCCSAIMNRVGEIDTRALFDDFIARVENGGEYPELDFFHLPNTDMGKCDLMMRDGYALIASGEFFDTALGRAAVEGIERGGDYWGNSIAYLPLGFESLKIGDCSVTAFTSGVLRKISILPETEAAALFTAMKSGGNMEAIKKEAARRLFGDELADQLEELVDGVNRAVAEDGLIARSGDGDKCGDARQCDCERAAEQPAQNEQPAEEQRAAPPDAEQLAAMHSEGAEIVKLREGVEHIGAHVAQVQELMHTFSDALGKISERLDALEASDEERKRAWLGDVRFIPAPPAHRPRAARAENSDGEEINTNDYVNALLQSKGLA